MSAICVFDPATVGNVSEINFGDPSVDGTWKITPSGNNLSTQKRESGSFVEKSAVTP
jgi:hypothetical protein